MKLGQKSVKKLVGFLVHVETPKFWDFLQKEIFKQIGHHLWTFPICKRCLKFIFSIIYRILSVQYETLETKIVADICVIYSSYVIPTKTKKTYLSLYDFDHGRPERKFTPTPKFLGMAAAYFVYHIGPIFQISLTYAFFNHELLNSMVQKLCWNARRWKVRGWKFWGWKVRGWSLGLKGPGLRCPSIVFSTWFCFVLYLVDTTNENS